MPLVSADTAGRRLTAIPFTPTPKGAGTLGYPGGYALQFVESDRVLVVDAHRRAQANEALLVRDLMPRLDQIHDGDDVAIRDLLLQTIPAYRHRLHP